MKLNTISVLFIYSFFNKSVCGYFSWSDILEDYTVLEKRESRVLKNEGIYIGSPNINLQTQKTMPDNATNVKSYKQYPSSQPGRRQVSETDIFLLNAIEKLVFKVDHLEKRLYRVEQMLYFAVSGDRIDHDPCPNNFTRIYNGCYMFGNYVSEPKNWKVANKFCKHYAAHLVEFETNEENRFIVDYIQSNSNMKGQRYWTGGLNPGLLWIWSSSAKTIQSDESHTAQVNNIDSSTGNTGSIDIKGEGRCLLLNYDNRSYKYRGTDCSLKYSFICESDSTVENQVKRLGRSKNILLNEF